MAKSIEIQLVGKNGKQTNLINAIAIKMAALQEYGLSKNGAYTARNFAETYNEEVVANIKDQVFDLDDLAESTIDNKTREAFNNEIKADNIDKKLLETESFVNNAIGTFTGSKDLSGEDLTKELMKIDLRRKKQITVGAGVRDGKIYTQKFSSGRSYDKDAYAVAMTLEYGGGRWSSKPRPIFALTLKSDKFREAIQKQRAYSLAGIRKIWAALNGTNQDLNKAGSILANHHRKSPLKKEGV